MTAGKNYCDFILRNMIWMQDVATADEKPIPNQRCHHDFRHYKENFKPNKIVQLWCL